MIGSLNIFKQFTNLSKDQKGLFFIFFAALVPLSYKLISPFFIIAGLGEYTIIITPTLYVIGFLMASNIAKRSITVKDILFYLFLVTFFLLSPALYPSSLNFVEENAQKFLLNVVPFFFVGLCMSYDRDKDVLLLVARIGFWAQIFWQACLLLGFVEMGESFDDTLGEQMETAYGFLFSLFFLFHNAIKRRDICDLVMFIIGTFLLLSMGARGPIIVLAFYILIYLIVFNTHKKKNVFKKLIVIIFCFLFYYFLTPIMFFLSFYAKQFVFSTRVFRSIFEYHMTNLSESSYRDEFYGNVWDAIRNDNTLLGYGFGSDRLFTPTGGYTHNLELELLVSFGIIGGGLILCILAFRFLKSLQHGGETKMFSFMMLCLGIVSLQFSYSYILFPSFFIYLGYNTALLRTNAKELKAYVR